MNKADRNAHKSTSSLHGAATLGKTDLYYHKVEIFMKDQLIQEKIPSYFSFGSHILIQNSRALYPGIICNNQVINASKTGVITTRPRLDQEFR